MYAEKLKKLAMTEGYADPQQLLEEYVCRARVPAICINRGCDSTAYMEPDQEEGWCEDCEDGSMQSCLILGGVI